MPVPCRKQNTLAPTMLTMVLCWSLGLPGAVRITQDTPQRLSFTFEMGGYSVAQMRHDGRDFSRVVFGSANCHVADGGGFCLPGVSLHVGVPGEGAVRVRFVSLQVRRVQLDRPLADRDEAPFPAGTLTPEFADPWISRPHYRQMRELRTARLVLSPFRYDAQKRELSVLISGSCVIEFPSGAPASGCLETNDFTDMLRSMLLNYDTAQRWGARRDRGLAKTRTGSRLPLSKALLTFEIGDGHSGVSETTTEENGIVRIFGRDILPHLTRSVGIDGIALRGSTKRDLDQAVPDDIVPHGVVEIPLMRFDMNGNAKLDDDDYFLAYVAGTSDWIGDPVSGSFTFLHNHYEGFRHYWLVDTMGASVAAFDTSGIPDVSGAALQTTFLNRVRYKHPSLLHTIYSGSSQTLMEAEGGFMWIWQRLYAGLPSFSYDLGITDAAPDSIGYLLVNLDHHGTAPVSFRIGNSRVYDTLSSAPNSWHEITDWEDQSISLAFIGKGKSSFVDLVHMDVRYRRSLDMAGITTLRIYSPKEAGLVRYRVRNLPAERTFILRIPPDESRISLIDTVTSGGTYEWVDSSGVGIQYFVCAESGLLETPLLAEPARGNASDYSVVELRRASNRGDYVIITHGSFAGAAMELARHKKSTGRFSSPVVVDVVDIYREFAGGNMDPVAIRNFLTYAFRHWSVRPVYVLLMGNGHFDYRGFRYSEPNYVPPYEGKDELCSEDFFTTLSPHQDASSDNSAFDVFLGRIPCMSPAEARGFVDKVVEMEGEDADYGSWRNRILLVADDDMQRALPDRLGSQHLDASENVYDTLVVVRPSLDIRKVYLFEYEWNQRYEKPEAGAAILNAINRTGVSVVNYFGHGSDQVWADEEVLRTSSMGELDNKGKYPLVGSFSCSVGRFDKPEHDCLSGLLVRAVGKGAIAALSSTREAWAAANGRMARDFYALLFEQDRARTIGQAYGWIASNNRVADRYSLLGDPSIRFFAVTDSAVMQILANGSPVDTLKALQTVTISGRIERAKRLNTDFGTTAAPAYVEIGIYNPTLDSARRKDGGDASNFTYSLPGSPVFVGKTKVVRGVFEQTVLLPRNVAFLKPGVRLTAYAWNGTNFAVGCRKNIIFNGTDTLISDDGEGPRLAVRPVYRQTDWNADVGFTDRIVTLLPAECEISVWDENGIDLTGTGPDEGLTLEVVGVVPRYHLNHIFVFGEGSYTQGTATVSFEQDEMPPGTYDMIVTACDLLGNTSKLTLQLDIRSQVDFGLGHVFNYPNPVRMGMSTKIYFYHPNTADEYLYGLVEATVKIYTLSGKLIRILPDSRVKQVQNGVEWDLRDARGRRVTPNIYLYRVIVESKGLMKTVESPIKKIVVHPPG